MSVPTTPTSSSMDRNLDAALATVATEIARTDGKASLLLAFNGATLAGLTTVAAKDLPTVTRVLGALAVLALGVAACCCSWSCGPGSAATTGPRSPIGRA